MKVKIPRNDLNRFKEKAVNLETNSTFPILKYIKFEIRGISCEITKNNLKEFVISKFPDSGNSDCSFLVLENTLFEFLEHSGSKFIQFEQIRYTIKIFDDFSSVESQTESAQQFVTPDLNPTTWSKISKDTLESIGIASKLIFGDELVGTKSNVYVGEGYVAGSDGIIFFCAVMTDTIPNLVLKKDRAETISKLKYCQYSYNNSFEYYKEDSTTYGFSRIESEFVNYVSKFGQIESDYSFKIPKKQIIEFCDLCLKTIASKKEIVAASFYPENNSLILTMTEAISKSRII